MEPQPDSPRTVLDRLRGQLLRRLPDLSGQGYQAPLLDLAELSTLAAVVRNYVAAEREFAGIPTPPEGPA